jgi:GAF domain-containing protein
MPTFAENFKSTWATQGIWAAMRWLNAQTPYRYTAIFAFEGDMLHNVCLVDKLDPSIIGCEDQPITNSYCLYIHRSHERLSIEDSTADPLVQGHPKRNAYQCYYGVPLFASDGRLVGTVCHFDMAPTKVTAGVVSDLDDLAPFIAHAAFGPERTPGPTQP